jgi:hypothetical protein
MFSVFGQADINLEGNWRLTLAQGIPMKIKMEVEI